MTQRPALSPAHAPPVSVPLRFFVTGVGFALLAGGMLLWQGPALLAAPRAPAGIALVHLLTLGFITTIALGALLQMVPVLGQVHLPRPRLLAAVVHPLMLLGTLGLAGGMLAPATALLRAGGAALGAGTAVFLVAMAVTLARAGPRGNATLAGMRLALLGLALTVLAGLGRLAVWAGAPGLPPAAAAVHLTWGLLGWLGLLIMAVAWQVVPMFLHAPQYPAPLRRWLPRVLFVLLLGWSAAALAGAPGWVRAAIEVALAAGVAAFALFTLRLQPRRAGRSAPPLGGYWRLAMLCLLGAAALWPAAGLAAAPATAGRVVAALVLAGVVSSVMLGMLQHIVPFLVWLQARGRPGGPHNVEQVLPRQRARLQLRLHAAAVALLAAACVAPGWARAAGVAWLASVGVLALNLGRALAVLRRASGNA